MVVAGGIAGIDAGDIDGDVDDALERVGCDVDVALERPESTNGSREDVVRPESAVDFTSVTRGAAFRAARRGDPPFNTSALAKTESAWKVRPCG